MTNDLPEVLIVDDNVNNLRLLSSVLQVEKFRLRLAPNGDLAIASMRSHLPDVVLLDINMPGLNGFETCSRLKADPQTADVPVLFVTALTDSEEIVHGFACGGVDFITKPFHPQVLLARVRTHVRLGRMQQSLRLENRQRREAEDAAAMASRAKSEFLANMSHEIRTPMNVILGMAYLTLQSNLEPRQRNYVQKVHQAAESLLGIINDILDFSKIEAGKLQLDPIAFRLDDVLDNLASLVGLQAEEKALELLFDLPADLPPICLGDPLRLGQVLINLANNAVKFTPRGEVVLAIEVLERQAETICLRFAVTDTGVGMNAQTVSQLFQSFMQADSSTSRRHGGTGLGLAISDKLVRMMGGELKAESRVGEGTTFSFELRFDVPASTGIDREAELTPTGTALVGCRILVVDDNATARHIFAEQARAFGMVSVQADGGAQALAAVALASASGEPIDLVLLDWKMPGLDGIECVRELARAAPGRQPLVVMTTAFGRDEARQRLAAAGLAVHEILAKPIRPNTLLDACAAALGRPRPSADHARERGDDLAVHRERLQGARVLLVEDNAINQELAVALLEEVGIDVTVADDGRQALSILETQAFDGVLMDCQMPVMDGFETTGLIRANARWNAMPVIAMTANALLTDREEALAAGMDDHIAKPIVLEDMLQKLSRWLRPAAGSKA